MHILLKRLPSSLRREMILCQKLWSFQRAGIAVRTMEKMQQLQPDVVKDWPRRIFSGVQPTGSLHLGNYLGAVKKWTELQESKEDVTFCIVDMHSITMPQDPVTLRENIFKMAATVLACGVDPDQSNLFVQSAVAEHCELCWILSCLSTMARLAHLPQFKEKSRMVRDVPLGLYTYPVLQAADILLYKATHVPVGEDQVQHIQLTQHLAKIFNSKYGTTFPPCKAIIDNKEAARIRSLRDPSKKMSKSDPDPKSVIGLLDDPDDIIEKVKKALTDFRSDVTYEPNTRQGVSNLIVIHSLISGISIEKIVEEAKMQSTAQYKADVAEAIIEHFKPIRIKINSQLIRRSELIYLLDTGADKAREIAQQTMCEVRQRMGLGAQHLPALMEMKEEVSRVPVLNEKVKRKVERTATATATASASASMSASSSSSTSSSSAATSDSDRPTVPKQQMRVEKKRMEIKVDMKPETKKIPIIQPRQSEVKNLELKRDAQKANKEPKADAQKETKSDTETASDKEEIKL